MVTERSGNNRVENNRNNDSIGRQQCARKNTRRAVQGSWTAWWLTVLLCFLLIQLGRGQGDLECFCHQLEWVAGESTCLILIECDCNAKFTIKYGERYWTHETEEVRLRAFEPAYVAITGLLPNALYKTMVETRRSGQGRGGPKTKGLTEKQCATHASSPTTPEPEVLTSFVWPTTTEIPILEEGPTNRPTTMAYITAAPTAFAPTTTAAPTTQAPTTAAQVTIDPTTAAPTTMAPTTMAPTTAAPTTIAPTTAAQTTMAPTTAAPTTVPPTTAAPTTMAPTTTAPTTVAPTTMAPTALSEEAEPYLTLIEAPATMASTTEAPATTAPTTAAPTTMAPTTAAPTTMAPTTATPATMAPTTAAPTAMAPTTAAQMTMVPITAAPTTVPPTPAAPTTMAPTTTAPTTVAPTTVAPTVFFEEAEPYLTLTTTTPLTTHSPSPFADMQTTIEPTPAGEPMPAAFLPNCTSSRLNGTTAAPGRDEFDLPTLPHVIISRPTNQSVTFQFLPASNITISIWYCHEFVQDEHCCTLSETLALRSNKPFQHVVNDLQPGTLYHYRLFFTNQNGTLFQSLANTFSTQKGKLDSYSFGVIADTHTHDGAFSFSAYQSTLSNINLKKLDFIVDLGDTFMIDKIEVPTMDLVEDRYMEYFKYWASICHSRALYQSTGNHDGECSWWRTEDGENIADWGSQFRTKYYSNPVPSSFYSANNEYEEKTTGGLRQNYYSWEWGSSQMWVLDIFWYGASKKPAITNDGWGYSLGVEQFAWLRRTLAGSRAAFKLFFVHNLVGGLFEGDNAYNARGGADVVDYFEWGGYNEDGTWGFEVNRPGWGNKSIHQLFVEHAVTICFKGHDHMFYTEEKDGIIYQTLHTPSWVDRMSPEVKGYSGFYLVQGVNYFPDPGYTIVYVGPQEMTVTGYYSTGEIMDSYTVLPATTLMMMAVDNKTNNSDGLTNTPTTFGNESDNNSSAPAVSLNATAPASYFTFNQSHHNSSGAPAIISRNETVNATYFAINESLVNSTSTTQMQETSSPTTIII